MATVKPPPGRVPKSIESVSPELYKFLVDLLFHDFQVWKRTGGGDDVIEAITSSETYETSNSAGETQDQINSLEQIEDLIPFYPVKVFDATVQTQDYTAVDGDYVEASNRITVKLDDNATHNDEIMIANDDGSQIIIDAQSNKIHHTSNNRFLTMQNKGTSLHLHFFSTSIGGHWRIR